MAEAQDRDARPSPEALLELARADGSGRLKIFLGAAPGVGKTYEMLESARAKRAEGLDVVVGVVETHGRVETAGLLEGLEIVPRRVVPYRGRALEELDLDAVLARRPQLVLVDELAHSNAPDSRHPKRWMDVEEILAAGIDVWTTLNVQHVESVTHAVASITHVLVRETVPDKVIDQAAEVELVDLTPEDLRVRLREGKVYVPDEARRALDQYFSPANLTALRELALRRTADRVDDEMLRLVRARGLAGPFATSERLLVGIHPGKGATGLVRYTKRLADRLKAPWTAVHVRTDRAHAASEAERDRVAETLRLAERLGADTLVLVDEHVGDAVLAFARANHITQIVVGATHLSAWQEWLSGSLARFLIREAREITIHVLPIEGDAAAPAKRASGRMTPRFRARPIGWLGTVAMVLVATALAVGIGRAVDLANIALVFLAPVILAAFWFGTGPSLLAAGLATMSYNFFFLEPLYTFQISDPENATAIVIFSLVALVTSGLATRARERTRAAQAEAARAGSLYTFARKLVGVATLDDLLWAAAHQIAAMLKLEVVILMPEEGSLQLHAAYPPEDTISSADLAAARWSFDHDRAAGRDSDTLPGATRLYLPIRTPRERHGVLGIRRKADGPMLTPDERRLLDAIVDQTAVALERIQLARDVDQARVLTETERLRTALLTSLGHDLKTPLASILGTISALRTMDALYDAPAREAMLATAQEEAERLDRFLENLRDLTRLEAGALAPKRESVDLADAASCAIRRTEKLLARHLTSLEVEPDLPLMRLDFVLLEIVLVNILENAARYAPVGSRVRLSSRRAGDGVVLEVEDEGPGIPAGESSLVFERFYRGLATSGAVAGSGLGLAVARGFVEAMGGTIVAVPRADTTPGTVFRISFPGQLIADGLPLQRQRVA